MRAHHCCAQAYVGKRLGKFKKKLFFVSLLMRFNKCCLAAQFPPSKNGFSLQARDKPKSELRRAHRAQLQPGPPQQRSACYTIPTPGQACHSPLPMQPVQKMNQGPAAATPDAFGPLLSASSTTTRVSRAGGAPSGPGFATWGAGLPVRVVPATVRPSVPLRGVLGPQHRYPSRRPAKAVPTPPTRHKRRQPWELQEKEKWHCPNGCGKFYRRTSSKSIQAHFLRCPRATPAQKGQARARTAAQGKKRKKAMPKKPAWAKHPTASSIALPSKVREGQLCPKLRRVLHSNAPVRVARPVSTLADGTFSPSEINEMRRRLLEAQRAGRTGLSQVERAQSRVQVRRMLQRLVQITKQVERHSHEMGAAAASGTNSGRSDAARIRDVVRELQMLVVEQGLVQPGSSSTQGSMHRHNSYIPQRYDAVAKSHDAINRCLPISPEARYADAKQKDMLTMLRGAAPNPAIPRNATFSPERKQPLPSTQLTPATESLLANQTPHTSSSPAVIKIPELFISPKGQFVVQDAARETSVKSLSSVLFPPLTQGDHAPPPLLGSADGFGSGLINSPSSSLGGGTKLVSSPITSPMSITIADGTPKFDSIYPHVSFEEGSGKKEVKID